MKWCLINNKGVENDAFIWLRTQNPTTKPGANHDGVNQLYVDLPPAELLVGIEVALVFDSEEENRAVAIMGLVAQAAVFMLSDSSRVLTGEDWMFKEMFNTPQHRIWVGNYEDNQAQYESDFLAVFDTASGDTPSTTATAMIKGYFSG